MGLARTHQQREGKAIAGLRTGGTAGLRLALFPLLLLVLTLTPKEPPCQIRASNDITPLVAPADLQAGIGAAAAWHAASSSYGPSFGILGEYGKDRSAAKGHSSALATHSASTEQLLRSMPHVGEQPEHAHEKCSRRSIGLQR